MSAIISWDGRLLALLVILSLAVLGFARKVYQYRNLKEDFETIGQYRQKFLEYVEKEYSNSTSSEEFNYLVKNSERAQIILRGFGYISSFKPPYAQVVYKRYAIILNAIPEIDSIFHNHPLSGFRGTSDLADNYIRIVDNCLVRFGGATEYKLQSITSDLKNPIKWLVEGFKLILLPIPYLLKTFGLVSSGTAEKISDSFIIKFMSFIFFIVGGTSSLVTVIIGWDEFCLKFNQLLAHF